MNLATDEINRAKNCIEKSEERRSSLIRSLQELEGMRERSPISLVYPQVTWEAIREYHDKLRELQHLRERVVDAAEEFRTETVPVSTTTGPTENTYIELLQECTVLAEDIARRKRLIGTSTIDDTTAYFEHTHQIRSHIQSEEEMQNSARAFLLAQKLRYETAMRCLEKCSDSIHEDRHST